MATGRASKAECLAGFSNTIGCVPSLGPDAFVKTDRFDPSERVTRADADREVSSRAGLLDALDDARRGDVVWVDGDVDMGDAEDVSVEGVTLASGYGLPDDPAGRLHSDEKPGPMLSAEDGARVTGLRVHGDEFEYFDPADRFPDVDKPIYRVGASTGIFVRGDGVEVDNLELSGWTYAGVGVRREGRADTSTHIHHVDAVDNPAESVGYGVEAREGRPLIEHSYFDNNRHSVAGSGFENCGYVLRYCVVGDYHSSHPIDMHGRSREGHDVKIAGRRTRIANNVVKFRQSHLDGTRLSAVKFRGRPLERSVVAHNWFFNDNDACDSADASSAVRQVAGPRHEYVNLDVRDNVYGTNADRR